MNDDANLEVDILKETWTNVLFLELPMCIKKGSYHKTELLHVITGLA